MAVQDPGIWWNLDGIGTRLPSVQDCSTSHQPLTELCQDSAWRKQLNMLNWNCMLYAPTNWRRAVLVATHTNPIYKLTWQSGQTSSQGHCWNLKIEYQCGTSIEPSVRETYDRWWWYVANQFIIKNHETSSITVKVNQDHIKALCWSWPNPSALGRGCVRLRLRQSLSNGCGQQDCLKMRIFPDIHVYYCLLLE